MRRRHTPYAQRLGDQLNSIAARFDELLDESTIVADDTNDPGDDIVFVGVAPWRWGPSTPEADLLRMQIKGDYIDWHHRLALLFPHPTPDVARELTDLDEFVRSWLDRDANDFLLPPMIDEAKQVAADRWDRFRALLAMVAPTGDSGLRLIPDTNSLIRNPDLATYGRPFDGKGFTVHVVSTVLGEIDNLKDRGRTPEIQDKARAVNRRLKGLRDKGSLAVGVALTRTITVRTEAREVDVRGTLDWLDPNVDDDRIAAAALRLQSDHPRDTVILVTSDLGLQTKADAIGLPYEETPPAIKDLQAVLAPSIAWEPGEQASRRATCSHSPSPTPGELRPGTSPSRSPVPATGGRGPSELGRGPRRRSGSTAPWCRRWDPCSPTTPSSRSPGPTTTATTSESGPSRPTRRPRHPNAARGRPAPAEPAQHYLDRPASEERLSERPRGPHRRSGQRSRRP